MFVAKFKIETIVRIWKLIITDIHLGWPCVCSPTWNVVAPCPLKMSKLKSVRYFWQCWFYFTHTFLLIWCFQETIPLYCTINGLVYFRDDSPFWWHFQIGCPPTLVALLLPSKFFSFPAKTLSIRSQVDIELQQKFEMGPNVPYFSSYCGQVC